MLRGRGVWFYNQSLHSWVKLNMTKQCFFCSQNMNEVDYKEVDLLRRFVSSQAKIIDPKHSNVCAKHQRKVSEAVKRARHMALLPFVSR